MTTSCFSEKPADRVRGGSALGAEQFLRPLGELLARQVAVPFGLRLAQDVHRAGLGAFGAERGDAEVERDAVGGEEADADDFGGEAVRGRS